MSSDEKTAQMKEGMDIRKIMKYLPHRFPFLLVDRVVNLVRNEYVDAYKCVSINEPFFQGHFPGLPVMPGVLIVEALAQAGGFLILAGNACYEKDDNIFLFTGIESVRFRKPVVPGDRLDLHCQLIRKRMQLWKMRGTASVDGTLVAEAELTGAIMARGDFS